MIFPDFSNLFKIPWQENAFPFFQVFQSEWELSIKVKNDAAASCRDKDWSLMIHYGSSDLRALSLWPFRRETINYHRRPFLILIYTIAETGTEHRGQNPVLLRRNEPRRALGKENSLYKVQLHYRYAIDCFSSFSVADSVSGLCPPPPCKNSHKRRPHRFHVTWPPPSLASPLDPLLHSLSKGCYTAQQQ